MNLVKKMIQQQTEGRFDLNRILVAALVVSWGFGQLLILPSPWSQIRVYALDLLALLVVLYQLLSGRFRLWLKEPMFKPIILLIAVTGFSLLLGVIGFDIFSFFIAASYWLRLTCYLLVFFAIRQVSLEDKRLPEWLGLGIFLVIGFGQYFLFPDTRILANFGFDDHYYRLIGSFLDPNFTGLVLAVFTLITINHFKGKQKLFFFIPLWGLALTFSRSSYLAFVIGLLYLVIRKRWWPMLGVIAILVSLIYLAPKPFGEGVNLGRTYSITSRVGTQVESLKLIQEKPIIGHGFNTLALGRSGLSTKFTAQRGSGIDNSFLYLLATSGVIGLLALGYFVWTFWKAAGWTPVAQAGMLAILTHSLFNNSFFYPWILMLVLILVDWVFKAEK